MCAPQPIYKTLTVICNKYRTRIEVQYSGNTLDAIKFFQDHWLKMGISDRYTIEL